MNNSSSSAANFTGMLRSAVRMDNSALKGRIKQSNQIKFQLTYPA